VDPSEYTVRRATLDDLPTLKGLWETNRLPVLELERRLTEFQIVSRPDGVIVGAVALRGCGAQGLVHSEAVYSPPLAEPVRTAAWQRLRVLARNQGMTRLWMRGEPATGWQALGFKRAMPGDLKKFPPALTAGPGPWSTLALIDEAVLAEVVEKEVTAFQQEAQADHERLRRQALWFKWLAGLIAFGFFAGAVWLLYQVLSRTHRPSGR
jgi:N-acetylglutamate synthase-like GNAT family acetyltransferase